MDDLLRSAMKQLASSSYYNVVYEEYIIPEMRKMMLLEEFDLDTPAEDVKLDNMSRIRSYKCLEEIFDNINRMNTPDVISNPVDQMI